MFIGQTQFTSKCEQQGADESFDDFFKRFDTQNSTLETVGGNISLHPGIAL
jgi:hypothetical protein